MFFLSNDFLTKNFIFCAVLITQRIERYNCRGITRRYRNSSPQVFLGKSVLKLCRKFTGEQPCQTVVSIKLQSNFIEILHFGICYIFSKNFFLRTPMEDCFLTYNCRVVTALQPLTIFAKFQSKTFNRVLLIDLYN